MTSRFEGNHHEDSKSTQGFNEGWSWLSGWQFSKSARSPAEIHRCQQKRHLSRLRGYRQTMLAEKTQLVPIAPLKDDFPPDDLKKATPSESKGIPPLQDGPVAFLENVFDDADHLKAGKLNSKHVPDCWEPDDWFLRDLVVDRIWRIKVAECINVAIVECLDPAFDHFSRLHFRVL